MENLPHWVRQVQILHMGAFSLTMVKIETFSYSPRHVLTRT